MDLLGRARKMLKNLGTPEAPATQFYRVRCPEGHILRGQRTEGYQALRCPACGGGVFILPRSPLPDPPAPASARRPRRPAPAPFVEEDGPIPLTDAPQQTTVSPSDIEIDWEEDVPASSAPQARPTPEPTPTAQPVEPRSRSAPRPAPSPPVPSRSAPRPRPAATDRGPGPEWNRPPVPTPPRPGLRQALHKNRHLLALAGVVLLVAATIGLRTLRNRLEQLPKIAETSRAEGIAALASGQFDLAKKKLAEAASALERLGDTEAAAVRQQADEAALFADLASSSLEEMMEAAATSDAGEDAFQRLHRGRSLILDQEICNTAPLDLCYRIQAGTRSGLIDLNGFKLLAGKSAGDRVTFGARLDSLRIGKDGLWHFGLQPESGVFILSDEGRQAAQQIGLMTPSEILDRQPAGEVAPP